MRYGIIILAVCLTGFLIPGCEKVTDYYLGIPQQPEFEENTFEEGLNILAIIRPDTTGPYNRSFAYLQEISHALGEQDFSLVKGVEVTLVDHTDPDSPDSLIFPLVPADEFFRDTLYRPTETFTPVPGTRYSILCRHPELPAAVGSAVFPPPPVIREGSLVYASQMVHLEVEPDPLIKLIDLYYSSDQHSGMLGRFVPNDSVPLLIEAVLPADITHTKLTLYAYDANLANYYANSNISLNFNKYRTTISTLESGFGVFGGLNFTFVNIGD